MEEMSKREKFVDDLKVVGYINDKKSEIKRKEQEKEVYKARAKKIAAKRRKAKQRRKRISAIVAAGLVAFGSYGAKKAYDYNIKPVTLEEALEGGKTLEELGLSQSNLNKLEEIKLQLLDKEDLSREEIQDLGKEIEDFELSIVKDKIKNTLNISNNIQLKPRKEASDSSIVIFSEEGEKNKCLIEDKNYDREIGNFIETIANLQIAKDAYRNGINNRAEILEKYDKSLNEAERFASSEITVTEKGKINMYRTTKADLEKIKENESKKVASREDEGR